MEGIEEDVSRGTLGRARVTVCAEERMRSFLKSENRGGPRW